MSTPSFEELREAAEKSWTTDGPNSDGVEGWFLVAGQLYRHLSDWHGVEVSPSISPDEFRHFYRNNSDARIAAILDFLDQQAR